MEVKPISLHRPNDEDLNSNSNGTTISSSSTESVSEHVEEQQQVEQEEEEEEQQEEEEEEQQEEEEEEQSASGDKQESKDTIQEQEEGTAPDQDEEDEAEVEVELHNDVDYDPATALSSDDSKFLPSEAPNNGESNDEEDEDDYDPELALEQSPLPTHQDTNKEPPKSQTLPPPPPSILKGKPTPVGLPPKPPVMAGSHKKVVSPTPATTQIPDPQHKLKEAYDAVMHSEIAKDPNFVNLPQDEQMKLIIDQLNKQGVSLTSSNKAMNYDQVYSYNKPFKNLKDPIPLVPVNEYCRRPNITAPMSREEEHAYEEFIKQESYYMNLQNWDEFPDKSRLFIGNLPANTISKQDLFRIFSQYGDVIQIAIKAGYGFVQFRTAEACLECIKGETNVPLHNKILRLDASKPQKSRRPGRPEINNPNLSSRGRERIREDELSPQNKRRKVNVDCMVYITGKSSVFFVRQVKKAFSNCQVMIDTEDITHRNLSDVISEAAYSGVLGACVVKEFKVDVQTFESTPDGGIKFDEYADIDPEVGADLIAKAKNKRYGGNPPTYYPQDVSYNAPPEPAPYQQPQPYGVDPYYNEPMHSNHYDRDRKRGKRGGRDRKHRDRGRGGYSNQGWDQQPQSQPYGSSSSPYNQYNQPVPSQTQFQPPTSQPYRFAQQASTPAPAPTQSDQAGLMSALQGLNPSQVQEMISLLQQQQQQQQTPPQQHYNQGGYGGHGGQYSNNYGGSNQVNALLSQLQNRQGSSYSSQQPQQSQQQQQQGGSSTQSLMETLARLARK